MKKRKRKKKTSEELAAHARQDDLTRRLQLAIDRSRSRLDERTPREESSGANRVDPPMRKRWIEMSRAERLAERARSRELDRRLLAAIERYRELTAEKRRRREAEAS